MLSRLLFTLALPIVLAQGPALAQTQGSTATSNAPNAAQSAQNLPQEIQKKLTDQGFTQVQVVPGSFIVSAKDKQGDPVTMVIGPNSMTMFTTTSSGSSSTVGSASNQSGPASNHNGSSGNR